MRRVLTAALALVLLASCSTQHPSVIQCDLEDALEGTIAFGIENVLNCKSPSAVRQDVNAWVDKTGACAAEAPKAPHGGLKALPVGSSVICSVLASAVVGSLGQAAAQRIPPTWECNPSGAIAAVSDLASFGCNAVFGAASLAATSKAAPAPDWWNHIPAVQTAPFKNKKGKKK